MDEILKSSEEWQKLSDRLVVDPDGWDRIRFDKSWAELITQDEYQRREDMSTTMPRNEVPYGDRIRR